MEQLLLSDNTDYQDLPAPAKGKRAICPGCKKVRVVAYNKTLKPDVFAGMSVEGMKKWQAIPRKWYYKGYGYFCSLTCATRYANATVKRNLKLMANILKS